MRKFNEVIAKITGRVFVNSRMPQQRSSVELAVHEPDYPRWDRATLASERQVPAPFAILVAGVSRSSMVAVAGGCIACAALTRAQVRELMEACAEALEEPDSDVSSAR